MSFYINNTNSAKPGPLGNNGINGICEKVLIETTKVFDACVCQTTETGVVLPLTDLNPENPTLPLTYISAQATSTTPVISDLTIDRIDSCQNYANVSATISIPVVVTYRDANGVVGTGSSTITLRKSVILFVPQPSVAPINITATTVVSSDIGTFVSDNTFSATVCIQLVIKVTAPVDVLVPSFGYPCIPPCQAAPEATCPGINVPLYPSACPNAGTPRFNQ